MKTNDQMLEEQIQYYRERATEYDEWFLRQGRYFLGEEHKQGWLNEIEVVEKALMESEPSGHILELACGTGLWTKILNPLSNELTAIDASPEAIDICKKRIQDDSVNFYIHNIFDWKPLKLYDFIFFGFWLSHVPSELFDSFWELVKTSLKPNGKIFFVDSLFSQKSNAVNHRPVDHSGIVERKLNNGQTYNIVKIFHEPTDLYNRLTAFDLSGFVRKSSQYFLYGCLSNKT